MKAKILTIIILFVCGIASAQKVKIKKGTVYIDKQEYLTIDNEFGNETILTLDGAEILILKVYSFDKPNPARNNTHNPNRYKYPATVKEYYYVISFLDFELEYETDLSKKKLFLAFYKYNLLDELNRVNEDNAKRIGQKISKNISGERPIIIYRTN